MGGSEGKSKWDKWKDKIGGREGRREEEECREGKGQRKGGREVQRGKGQRKGGREEGWKANVLTDNSARKREK